MTTKRIENPLNEKFVYHGSEIEFDSDIAIPRRNIRIGKDENGKDVTIFDEESFHATPYKWIALAYTFSPKPYEIDGKTAHYNMGVSLYENTKDVYIYGFDSLKKSLEVMYGKGGYLYYFDKSSFTYKKGLGSLEVITDKPIKPLTVERIINPVNEMKKLGVTFHLIDLALPENEKYRNYSIG